MLDPARLEQVVQALPVLQRADPDLLRQFSQTAYLARIPAGRDVFAEGDVAEAIPLLAGLFDFCVFVPLFGAPLSGPMIRAPKEQQPQP